MNPSSVEYELRDWCIGYKKLLEKTLKLKEILKISNDQICYGMHDIQVEGFNIKIRFTGNINPDLIIELSKAQISFKVTTDDDHIKDWENSATRTYQTVII